MMTLDEAIQHAESVSQTAECAECRAEYKQLAEWLRELKEYRASREWISMEDRPPNLMDYVLTYSPNFAIPITTQFYGRQVSFNGNVIDGFQMRRNEITHWMFLPKPPRRNKYERHIGKRN